MSSILVHCTISNFESGSVLCIHLSLPPASYFLSSHSFLITTQVLLSIRKRSHRLCLTLSPSLSLSALLRHDPIKLLLLFISTLYVNFLTSSYFNSYSSYLGKMQRTSSIISKGLRLLLPTVPTSASSVCYNSIKPSAASRVLQFVQSYNRARILHH